MVPSDNQEVLMDVMIGIDPHKASHTAVAIDGGETELSTSRCGPPSARWTSC